MKLNALVALVVSVCSASGAILTFNSSGAANNAATQAAFIAAIGETQDFTINFNSLSDGANIHGVPLGSGFQLFDTNAIGGNVVEVECTTNGIGGSNPMGSCAAAHDERAYLRFSFATPVDYVSFFDIDSAATTGFIDLVGGGSVAFSLDTTAASGNSGEFFGVFRNNISSQIIGVRLDASGDGRWGVDNIGFGVVIPEPSTVGLFSVGAFLVGLLRAGARRD